MAYALLLSLAIHTLLFSLLLGGQGLGLPGLSLPWRDRRIDAAELRVMIVPAQIATPEPAVVPGPEPLQPAAVIKPPREPKQARAQAGPPAAPVVRQAKPAVVAAPKANVQAAAPDVVAPARADARADGSSDAGPAEPVQPALAALERFDEPTWDVPPAPPVKKRATAPAPRASSPQAAPRAPRGSGDGARKRIEPKPVERPAKLADAQVKTERQETEPQAEQQAEQRAALLREAAQAATRQEAARLDAARLEAERLVAERQEAARQAAIKQEAARQETARIEATRLEAERQEVARQAAVQQESARQETVRAEASRIEAARAQAAQAALQAAQQAKQDETDRREAVRRAMGRQLDEEAARRDAVAAAAAATRLPDGRPSSWSSARRGRLFGRADTNAELVLYAEAWARKIQLNMTFDKIRELAKRPHTHPMVTVAIRRDGSVESVVFVVSSGVAEIDLAIRQIVQSQAPYQAFQPGLASEFDVIEIRRTWYFDTAIRLY